MLILHWTFFFDQISFDSYLEMRKQIKKPATPHAVNLIKKKLVQMTNNNESDMCDLLNQSIICIHSVKHEGGAPVGSV